MPSARPNILFLVADQHQARLLGCAGHEHIHTPNLDRLARRGVLCTGAYTTNPICTPSRVSMLSGQYPHNHGYFGLSGPTPAALPNLFGHVRQHGYRTAGIGKLHLPDDPRNWVAADLDLFADCYRDERGDRFNSAYHRYLQGHRLFDDEDSRQLPGRNGRTNAFDARPTTMPKEHVVEYWCAREAIRFAAANTDAPWCMQVSFPRPHYQLTPLLEFWEQYRDIPLPDYYLQPSDGRAPHFRKVQEHWRNYGWPFHNGESDALKAGLTRCYRGTLACIAMVDDAIGQLLDALEAQGTLDSTIIVYTSDHGAYHGMHGIAEKYPGICSEEVCRVPLIWSFPPSLPMGSSCAALMENVDLVPTFLELANLPQMESTDGCARTELLRGQAAADDAIAVTENEWSKAIRWRQYRLIHYPSALFGEEPGGELYDLEADPWEMQNRYVDPAFADVRATMERRLLDWLICTSRNVTSHPPHERNERGNEVFRLADDRKESNLAGPRLRLRRGQVNYL